MNEMMQISAKTLGKVAMRDFCERCFWTLMHLDGGPPYSIFPSIFGRIDRYTKSLVHGYFDQHDKSPPWLTELNVTGYIDPPSSRKFRTAIGNNVLLTGEADAIYIKADGTLMIADYKTAYAKGDKDPLLPIYATQLNAYAFLAEILNLGQVSELALIYTEPRVGDEDANSKENLRDNGFCMGFEAKIHTMPLDIASIGPLLKRAKDVFDQGLPPSTREGCYDCIQAGRLRDLTLAADLDLTSM